MSKYLILCKSTPTEKNTIETNGYHKPLCSLTGRDNYLHIEDSKYTGKCFGFNFEDITAESILDSDYVQFAVRYYGYNRKCDAVRVMNSQKKWEEFEHGMWSHEYYIITIDY